jgi:hypothetical protein
MGELMERVWLVRVAIHVETNKGVYSQTVQRGDEEGADEFEERVVETMRQLTERD